jgi:hypothetical protein
MATTIEEITQFLTEMELKFGLRDGKVFTGFKTKNYRDSDGDDAIRIVIRLYENGEFLEIFSPNLYKCKESPNLHMVLQSLLMVSWSTKMVQFEYDANDGEIRAVIEFPLEDSKLTCKQLGRCMHGIAKIVDHYHPMIATALERGVIEAPQEDREAEELARAIQEAGGSPGDLFRQFTEFLASRKRGAVGLEE